MLVRGELVHLLRFPPELAQIPTTASCASCFRVDAAGIPGRRGPFPRRRRCILSKTLPQQLVSCGAAAREASQLPLLTPLVKEPFTRGYLTSSVLDERCESRFVCGTAQDKRLYCCCTTPLLSNARRRRRRVSKRKLTPPPQIIFCRTVQVYNIQKYD